MKLNCNDLRLRGVHVEITDDLIDFRAANDALLEFARTEIEANSKDIAAELRAEQDAEHDAPELFAAIAVGERLRLAYAHACIADLRGCKSTDRAIAELRRACRAADERIAAAAVAAGLSAEAMPREDALAARGWVLTQLAMRRASRVPA